MSEPENTDGRFTGVLFNRENDDDQPFIEVSDSTSFNIDRKRRLAGINRVNTIQKNIGTPDGTPVTFSAVNLHDEFVAADVRPIEFESNGRFAGVRVEETVDTRFGVTRPNIEVAEATAEQLGLTDTAIRTVPDHLDIGPGVPVTFTVEEQDGELLAADVRVAQAGERLLSCDDG